MRRAVHLALQEERLHEILEAADQEHLAVDPRVQLEVVEHGRARAAHAAPCRCEPLGEVVPVALEPVRVPRRRPGRRRLEPAHASSLHLVERVDAAGRGPEEVARPQRVAVAVRDDVDLSLEHVVRLLERMVVRMRDRAGLVVDHEHRVQLRVEPLVDEHLHGDAAVGEHGRRHARGDGRRADRARRCLRTSRSIWPSPSRKRLRFRGSRTSSGSGSVSGAGPRKNVSLPSGRGRGAAISIQRARPPQRKACGAPTGTTPQAPGSSCTPRPSR